MPVSQNKMLCARWNKYDPPKEIVDALTKHHGNITRACKDLHVSYRTLLRWVQSSYTLRILVDQLRDAHKQRMDEEWERRKQEKERGRDDHGRIQTP